VISDFGFRISDSNPKSEVRSPKSEMGRKDSTMRGRKPAGPEFVERLNGSNDAKQRARVILELIAHLCRVPEACERLGIGEARLDQIRIEGLQALVSALEDKPVGRPAHVPSPAEVENEHLRARIARLETELAVARVQVEVGVGLPRVGAELKKNGVTPPPSILNEVAAPGPSIPSEENIVANIKNLVGKQPVAEGPPRRGFSGQRADRENEQVIRGHVIATAQHLRQQGWTWGQMAQLLRIPDRTLRDWRLDFPTSTLAAIPLGRPAYLAPPAERNLVIQRIDELGPGVGLPTLRTQFPRIPRMELENILNRFRHEWRQSHREVLNQLQWSMPGAVWAIDHHGPRTPAVDGGFPYMLAVRDLASGQVLLWLPVSDATAHFVIEALEMLFIVHGAPLVLKSDNGSAFIAAPLRKLCRRFGVRNLYSPPRTPSYNGSIEATIGSLKIRTERYAAQHGRPGQWTTADADAARHEANSAAGPRGLSPNQAWTARPRLAQDQRDLFLEATARRFEDLAPAQDEPKDDAQHRAMDRAAISQVLVELGYLSITRGRIRLPVCKKKVATMS
jgi:transposase InsO family protein